MVNNNPPPLMLHCIMISFPHWTSIALARSLSSESHILHRFERSTWVVVLLDPIRLWTSRRDRFDDVAGVAALLRYHQCYRCSPFTLSPGLEQGGCLLRLWNPDFHRTETSTNFCFWEDIAKQNWSEWSLVMKFKLEACCISKFSKLLMMLYDACCKLHPESSLWPPSTWPCRLSFVIECVDDPSFHKGQEQVVMLSRCFKPQIRETPSENRWTPEIQQSFCGGRWNCLEPQLMTCDANARTILYICVPSTLPECSAPKMPMKGRQATSCDASRSCSWAPRSGPGPPMATWSKHWYVKFASCKCWKIQVSF